MSAERPFDTKISIAAPRGPAIGPLFAFLVWRSTRNRVLRQVARLRQPRYLLPAVLGAAYFYWIFFRPQPGAMRLASTPANPGIATAMALGVLLLVAGWWLFGADAYALAYSEAEVHFLFPAPVTRRQLVQYKLAAAQGAVLLNVLIWTLVLRRGGDGMERLTGALGLWAFLSILHMHRLGVALMRLGAVQHGARARWRALLPAAFAVGAAVVALGSIVHARSGIVAAWQVGMLPMMHALDTALAAPPAAIALAPTRWLTALLSTGRSGVWLPSVLTVLVLVPLHYLWVVRTSAAFEEAAVESSARRAELRHRRTQGRTSSPSQGARVNRVVALSPHGHPAVAIIHKNLVSVARATSLPAWGAVVLMACAVVAGMSLSPPVADVARNIAVACAIAAVALSIAGAAFVRNDLRTDLVHLPLLRTYPLTGAETVLAESTASTIVVLAAEVALLLVAASGWIAAGAPGLPLSMATIVAALVLMPVLSLASVLAHNAFVLLLPGWARIGHGGGGVEAMGQGMLGLVAVMSALAVLLVLPIAAGAAVAAAAPVFRQEMLSMVPAALLVGAIVLATELWLLVDILGRLYDRIETSEVGR